MDKKEEEYSFKNYFIPFTTAKAITWIVIIGFIVYANMLFNGFVLDDFPFIVNNPTITPFNLLSLIGNNIFNSYGFYRLIPSLYFGTMYQFFGVTTFFYHFIQVLLHISIAISVYFFFRKFIRNTIAFILSLIFLVHPMNVESVAYISAVDNPLFLLSGMLGLLLSTNEKITLRKTIFIFSLFFFSLLSKETGFLFIILALILRIFFYKKNVRVYLTLSISTVLFYLILRFKTIGYQPNNFFFFPIHQLSFVQRLINIPEIIYFYIMTFVFPKNLAIGQNWVVKSIDFAHFYLPLLLDILFFSFISGFGYYVLLRNRKQFSIYCFFVFWFLTGLGIVLQLIPLDATVADRWFYFPMVGLLGAIGVFANSFSKKKSKITYIAVGLCTVLIIILSLRTIIRNTNYADDMTLNLHDINVSDDFTKESEIGETLINRGEFKQALPYSQQSVKLNPFYGNIDILAFNYVYLGNPQKAEDYFNKLKRIPNNSFTPRSSYDNAATYLTIHYPQNAKSFILWALQSYPNDANLWANLAFIEYSNNNQEEAFIAIEKAKSIQSSESINMLYSTIIHDKKPSIKQNSSLNR